MLFNSSQFLVFFPVVILGYYIIPSKFRYLWLLIASYYFYMSWIPAYALLLLFSTVISYIGALALERLDGTPKRRLCLIIVVFISLAVLGYFKYANMFMGYLNKAISYTGRPELPWDNSIILPVGISFFTLQALGYLIDVYRKDIYAEKNLLKYALFISFFPQLVAGPIERSKNLLKQLAIPQKFSYENLRRGLVVMLYGYFLKVVIADRIALFVNTVYNAPAKYPGVYIIIATILFAFQIYCDFYGYSTIAKGIALTMGIHLMDNFNAPFFSKSISEFWRRWHISLSTWFRDYLYIPLGGSRKGVIRKYVNLIVVFGVSGLWHGASLSYVIWGILHGLFQMIESAFRIIVKGINKHHDTFKELDTASNKCLSVLITFALFCVALVFFRANSLSAAKELWHEMLTHNNWYTIVDQSLFGVGISRDYFHVLILAFLILGIIDYYKYTGMDVVEHFFRQYWWFRVLAEVGMMIFILLFGCYGTAYDVRQFIYFQF